MLESGGDNSNNKRIGQFRNRPTNRRNPRDRLDRVNSLGENGGGSVGVGGAVPAAIAEIRGNSGIGANTSGPPGETGTAASNGFSCTEAAQVMTQRWKATINALNNPSVDASERPVVYSSSEGGSVWGSSKLPFQVSVCDFLHDMGQAILRSNSTRVGNSHVMQANHTGYAKAETPAGGHN